MIHVAVRVRELVSSNIDAMINNATHPAKSLGLLRSEVEETLISLHSELTMTIRQQERTQSHAEKLKTEAETWTAKAKIAVDHGREDLARAALLARDNGMADAAAVQEEAAQLAKDVAELDAAIADLDAKRTDIVARAARLALGSQAVSPGGHAGIGTRDSRTARRLDRIDELERRLDFNESVPAEGSEAAIANADVEIAALSQASAIDAELEAMKAASKKLS
jgi:phage shock protein A